MRRYKNFVRIISTVLLCVGIMLLQGLQAQAAPAIDTSPLHGMSGDAKYIEYADNYQLDTVEPGMKLQERVKSIVNSIANGILSTIVGYAKIVVMLFYYCMDFDIAAMFSEEINGIQGTLNSGVFKPLFTLAFCGAAVNMLKKFFQRNFMGTFSEVLKALGIFALAALVVTNSGKVLSAATGLTKAVSTQILIGIQNEDSKDLDTQSYAKTSAGVLWSNLIHQPWSSLEFGNGEVDEDMVKMLLVDYAAGTEERADYIEDNADMFPLSRAGSRCSFLALYLIPFLAKGAIYIVLAVFMLAFQLLAVFFVLLAPVILLLAMLPGYEKIIDTWLKKILETQLGILILSFILGLLVKLDSLMFARADSLGGWMLVVVIQVVIDIVVVLKRNELLGMIGKFQRAATAPRYANATLRNTSANAAQAAMQIAGAGGQAAGRYHNSGRVTRNTARVLEYAAAYRQTQEQEREQTRAAVGGGSEPERPVLHERGGASGTVRAAAGGGRAPEAQEDVQEAQIQTERPRLDEWNVIHVKAVEGRLERSEEDGEVNPSVTYRGNGAAAVIPPPEAGRRRTSQTEASAQAQAQVVRPRLDSMPHPAAAPQEQSRHREVPRPSYSDRRIVNPGADEEIREERATQAGTQGPAPAEADWAPTVAPSPASAPTGQGRTPAAAQAGTGRRKRDKRETTAHTAYAVAPPEQSRPGNVPRPSYSDRRAVNLGADEEIREERATQAGTQGPVPAGQGWTPEAAPAPAETSRTPAPAPAGQGRTPAATQAGTGRAGSSRKKDNKETTVHAAHAAMTQSRGGSRREMPGEQDSRMEHPASGSRPASSVAEQKEHRIVLINKETEQTIAEVVTNQDMTAEDIMEAYGWEFNAEKGVWQLDGEEDISPENLEDITEARRQ